MKLRFKILLMCLGSTLLALTLQTFLFQSSSSQFIYNQSKADSENSLQNMKHNYATDIYEDPEQENAGKVLEYIASDESVMLVSSYYNPYREKDILRFVLKLYKNSNREHQIGYVVCDVDCKVFTAIMEKYYTNHMMYLWLQPSGDRPAVSLGELSEGEETGRSRISWILMILLNSVSSRSRTRPEIPN